MAETPNFSPLALSDLLATHPEYNPIVTMPSGVKKGLLEKYSELYEGGEKFEAIKEQYLRRRQADAQPKYRAARADAAHHPEQAASIIDLLAGNAFETTPTVAADTEDESQKKYWDTLNTDADGTGRDIAAVLYLAILDVLVHRRAYLAVDFPSSGTAPSSLALAKDSQKWNGRAPADGYIIGLCAKDVDDWEEDALGNLKWVRIHSVEKIRSGFKQAGYEQHTWSYITPTERTDYVALKECGKDWDDDLIITPLEPVAFDYGGRLPIARVEVPRGLWAMNRLAPRTMQIFNAEAGLAFLFDTNCLQMPVITSERDIKQIWISEIHALKLMPGESASFLAPSSVPFAELRAYIDKHEEKLYRALQSMAQLAAAKEGYGRQSGAAVERKNEAVNTIMAVYRGLLADALIKCLDLIKYVRGEQELKIKIDGLVKEKESADDAPPLDINGAVAQGVISLMQNNILTRDEVRKRLGFVENKNLPAEVDLTVEGVPNAGNPPALPIPTEDLHNA